MSAQACALSGAGAQGSLLICSLYWFFSASCCSFPSFCPTVFSRFFSSFLIFLNALLKSSYEAPANLSSLCSTCDPLWPWLCPDSLILHFFCPTFLWFSIFPSIHFLSSGFCYLCSTLNILAVFLLSITLVIRGLFILTCSVIGFS